MKNFKFIVVFLIVFVTKLSQVLPACIFDVKKSVRVLSLIQGGD